MKKLFSLLVSLILSVSAFAIKVQTYAMYEKEADSCCIQLVHVYHEDDGTYLGMGKSMLGIDENNDCCESSNEVDFKKFPELDGAVVERLREFNNTHAFKKSVEIALTEVKLGKAENLGSLEVSQNVKNDNLIISFNSKEAGSYLVLIHPFVGNDDYEQKVLAAAGYNEIELYYEPRRVTGSMLQMRILVINEKEGFVKIYRHFFH